MDQASVTVALSFGVAIGLFGLLTLFLVYDDQHPRPANVRSEPAAAPPAPAPTATPVFHIGRVRLGVVAVTFLIWSLLISEHLRARR